MKLISYMTWAEGNTLKHLREKTFDTAEQLSYAEALKICRNAKSFILYIQQNKDVYYSLGEFDRVESVLSYIPKEMFRPMRYIHKDFLDMVQEYLDKIMALGYNNSEIELYRGLKLKSEDDMDWDNVGNCWAYDYDSVPEFLRYFRDDVDGKPYLLSGVTDRDNIDWILSICLNLTHIDEKELRVYDETKIEDLYLEEIDEDD